MAEIHTVGDLVVGDVIRTRNGDVAVDAIDEQPDRYRIFRTSDGALHNLPVEAPSGRVD
ncbi:hypothetical protein [Miltoncostaea oceani]|uniref:hypothetical protein n=1 Tax=Miltoncostaea oceani TaxID=2843216 RepID=UPI001C3C3D79|nr:hypothetical protein [Miltoncostaea oceani]